MTKSKIPLKAGKLFILVALLLVGTPIFAQSVDTAWVRRYNGPGNSIDWPYNIAVDELGNVYVAGGSNGSGSLTDYATIKYYPNGDTAWVRRYNGPGNDQDQALAMKVDNSGNVYVTGYSTGLGTNLDITTIKYLANGDTAWVRRYSSPGSQADVGFAITVDNLENVYVTGRREGVYPDYATIKYDQYGNMIWVKTYNGPGNYWDESWDIAVDESGNVYVTGQSTGTQGNADFATIKYDSNGNTAWVRRYNGPVNGGDLAGDIGVDKSGNIYVNGLSSRSGIAGDCDYATIKYYPNGDTAWVRRYRGPVTTWGKAGGMVVDDSGNVYVTGFSDVSGTFDDYLTIKYHPNGDTAWVRRYDGPANYSDGARGITIDDSGNVFVTGASRGSDSNWDYVTIKYRPNGDLTWAIRYNGPANGSDDALAIAVDDSDNVYVTGHSDGVESYEDYATIKYVQFLCGDVNKDGVVNSADIIYLINYLFISGPAPIPIIQVGDVNRDGVVNVTDVVYLINYLFIGGPAPCS